MSEENKAVKIINYVTGFPLEMRFFENTFNNFKPNCVNITGEPIVWSYMGLLKRSDLDKAHETPNYWFSRYVYTVRFEIIKS